MHRRGLRNVALSRTTFGSTSMIPARSIYAFSSRGSWLWITYPTYIVHAIMYNTAAVPREVTSRFVALMRRRTSHCHSRKRSPTRHHPLSVLFVGGARLVSASRPSSLRVIATRYHDNIPSRILRGRAILIE